MIKIKSVFHKFVYNYKNTKKTYTETLDSLLFECSVVVSYRTRTIRKDFHIIVHIVVLLFLILFLWNFLS